MKHLQLYRHYIDTYIVHSSDSVLVVCSQRLHLRLAPLGHDRVLAHLQGTYRLASHRHPAGQDRRSGVVLIGRQLQETLFEGHIQCANLPPGLTCLLQILDRSTACYPVGPAAGIVVVVPVDTLQPLEILDDLHRVLDAECTLKALLNRPIEEQQHI